MSAEEFLRAYPRARSLEPEPSAAAGPLLRRFELSGQKVGPLRDCQLQFHFTGQPSKLFRIEGRCANAPEEVSRYLVATYGEPTRTAGNVVLWSGKSAEVNFNPRGGAFSINDIALSRSFIGSLMGALRQVPLAATPQSTPVATPAP